MPRSEAQLLAAIAASPDDDAPRLVYADALSAAGDVRGEFIALQCRLAANSDDDARRRLRVRENQLLEAHGAQGRFSRTCNIMNSFVVFSNTSNYRLTRS